MVDLPIKSRSLKLTAIAQIFILTVAIKPFFTQIMQQQTDSHDLISDGAI